MKDSTNLSSWILRAFFPIVHIAFASLDQDFVYQKTKSRTASGKIMPCHLAEDSLEERYALKGL